MHHAEIKAKDGAIAADSSELGNLTVRSLTVKHPDSKSSVVIQATPYGTGIWVTGEHGRRFVSIQAADNYVALELHDPDAKHGKLGGQFAIWMGPDNVPMLQVNSTDLQIVSVHDLLVPPEPPILPPPA